MPRDRTATRTVVLGSAGGLGAGITAGLFGVGGGVLLVPLIAIVLARPQHVAHATSLVAVTMAAGAGVVRFAMDGSVSVPGAVALAAGAIVGARVGARFLPKVSEGRLRTLFGVVLIVLAIRFLLIGASGEAATVRGFVPDMDATMLALHVGGGLLAGITSSVLGVGGGVIMVPLLVLGLGYGQHVAEGTSLAVIIPTALTGAISHHANEYTDWKLGGIVGIGSLVGGAVGATVALQLDPVTLGRLYGGLQLVMGVLVLARGRGRDELETS